ncbi:MAG: porphobilinogen synthase [Gammaproteobacteria bacterium]|jgi:porphobilinogen synthase|nr:porphobilinogen synthase [Gammaproteobacteria bacterium]MBT7603744.1 porphobilinogen synthase [Gammaproteobacteria bacterium]
MNKSYPNTRMRRNRSSNFIRNLIRETSFSVDDLIYPIFVLPGKNKEENIDSMPGKKRYSVDKLLPILEKLHNKGLNAVAIFPVIGNTKKSENAKEAFNPKGLVQSAVKIIKKEYPDLGLITDIALDPYTLSGHDGLVDKNGHVLNDQTVNVLKKQALSHAEAGADIVAPSDMMDGRVLAIRNILEQNKFHDTKILSYAAKYASNLYGPFRNAVESSSNLKESSKETYQMDFANSTEASLEINLDINEGADMVIIKPGLPYLDIVSKIKNKFSIPIFSYHVSGEYSMIKCAALKNYIDEKSSVLEVMHCFKRAGCNAVLTYYTPEIIKWLDEK